MHSPEIECANPFQDYQQGLEGDLGVKEKPSAHMVEVSIYEILLLNVRENPCSVSRFLDSKFQLIG